MKKIVVLFLVTVCIFSFGAMTMAADSGANLYLDYNFMNFNDDLNIPGLVNKSNNLTIGVDYDKDAVTLGAFYSTALSYEPALPSGVSVSTNNYFIYGGYNVVQSDSSLAVIASYLNISQDLMGSSFASGSSFGLGLKGDLNFGSGEASLLYSYGLSNKLTMLGTDATGTSNISYLELKGVYYFNETVGMHVAYRSISISNNDLDISGSYSGIGVGVDFKF